MGSPGSGKTTTGRILAQQMGLPYIDVDDDHLEPYWGKSVSEKVFVIPIAGLLQFTARVEFYCDIGCGDSYEFVHGCISYKEMRNTLQCFYSYLQF